jgi:plasmid stabilization system protein ParE
MSRAVWTPHAERELGDILFYISVRDRRPSTGEQIYYEIRQLADEYAQADAPRHVHPLAPPGWFYFRHKRWLVFYQSHAEGIEVMRVVDGARDLPSRLP